MGRWRECAERARALEWHHLERITARSARRRGSCVSSSRASARVPDRPVRWLERRVVGDDGPALQAPDALEEPRRFVRRDTEQSRRSRGAAEESASWGFRE